jgi:hypothetical protein
MKELEDKKEKKSEKRREPLDFRGVFERFKGKSSKKKPHEIMKERLQDVGTTGKD